MVKGIPADPKGTNAKVFKALKRAAKKRVAVPADLFSGWRAGKEEVSKLKAALRAAEKKQEQIDQQLWATIGDAEIGESPLGNVVVVTRNMPAYMSAARVDTWLEPEKVKKWNSIRSGTPRMMKRNSSSCSMMRVLNCLSMCVLFRGAGNSLGSIRIG